ncbi:MAG: nucleoside hydrolase [Planctomycetaceae bacterium]|nr:nucleoside hydrolase [Planctomycetaceae bacterium]
MPQKLIIDADPGLGDAFAVLTALVDPSVEVLGLTASAGTVSGLQAVRNLQYLTTLVDPVRHPRIGQSELPAILPAGGTEVTTRHNLSGPLGLGDVDVNVPDLHNRRESAKLIVDLVREHPHQVNILTLGPLTNLATACDLDAELPTLIQSIVCLGGSVHAPGDITPVAEFNIWADPEAAAEILRLPTNKVLVPLNVSGVSVLTFEDDDVLSELIAAATNGSVLSSMLQYSIRANRKLLAFEGIPLHSVVALAVAVRAERFHVEAVCADIETSGQLTRGMTVIDRRRCIPGRTNLDIVSSIDDAAVIDYFSRSLRHAAR